ncbi:DUF378 domain-containing protein [Anaerosacchariphilus polymeriproducens]|uniref:DUF378 domain-containing protein n=1 Tax=Anaerosacchariphilus polymeriproducens TaxID=1812858 RepID=A0A371AZG0_9FIRM|nr:DUF378 domain-containing protein [Anaerosacchariphilus polymeriproducens]RDU24985.1 DUF378 domain-containing protein [Anaerosacchariphilus polymeriproducens]
MKTLNIITLILVIIGAVNWGLIGLFRYDLVSSIFGDMSVLTRTIFGIVGIAGLYAFSFFARDKISNNA